MVGQLLLCMHKGNFLEADAIAHTDEFQLDPPFKLSNSRSKKNRAAVSALHV